MKKDIATKWVEALRSGKYKKTVGCLKKTENYENGSFCALGVLCDIYQKENDNPLPEARLNPKAKKTKVSINGEFDVLPKPVMDWAGIYQSDARIPSMQANIPELNDDQKLSFKEIADVIETHFESM
jgi:hypothetical protein